MISVCESVQNLKSGSGQQNVVSTESVVGGIALIEEEDAEEERLCSSGNSTSAGIIYGFLNYSLRNGKDGVVKNSVMKLAILATWVETLLNCFERMKRRGGHRQKVNSNAFKSYVSEAVNQPNGLVCMFVEI